MPDVSSGWGRLTWGQANWNEATTLTQGWGAEAWGSGGSWGDVGDEIVSTTGLEISSTYNPSITITAEINTGWGRIEWGINAWGEFGTALPTGIAASFSMAASEFLATKEENSGRSPIKAAIFTGVAYLFTVILLVTPYLFLDDNSDIILGLEPHYQALCATLIIGLLIIAKFNFYVSIAQDHSFRQRFTEMTAILIVVTSISFVIGVILRDWFAV